MRRAILGSVVNVLADKLPEHEEKLAGMMRAGHDEFAPRLIAEGIRGAEKSINDYLQAALKNSTALVKAVKNRK